MTTQVTLDFADMSGHDVLNVTFTLSQQQNIDHSYTVVAATGTFNSTIKITGLAPFNTDGSTNELFLGSGGAINFGGITLVTNANPAAATYFGTLPAAISADINLFYTGSTAVYHSVTLVTNAYAIDTAPLTYLTLTSETVTDPSCFLAGTLIRTLEGDRPVETLRRGETVVTVDGQAKRIDWIGRRRIVAQSCDSLRCWPVRIRAHALGDNQPRRDLMVSPDHAMLVGEVLVNAGALVNGLSIMRENAVPRTFTYYHLELDAHALILAENAPSESFIDNADRMGFDNWAEHEALFPEGKPMRELDLPRAKSARQVPARLRAALMRRAEALYGSQKAA